MIVWVADFFATGDVFGSPAYRADAGYVGGAELTSRALADVCPVPLVRVAARDLDEADLERHADATWVVENLSAALHHPAAYRALARVLGTRRVFRIEYDYGWCRIRSPVAHRLAGGGDCDCLADPYGPRARLFRLVHERAQHVFFMSAAQLEIHRRFLGSVMTARASVLGSCFSGATLDRIAALRPGRGRDWLVVAGRDEWHSLCKGTRSALAVAGALGLSVKRVGGLAYEDLLAEMATSAGLIFLPNDVDPSPRLVIEAKLMGRRLILNANVLHKDEPWFKDASPDGVAEYLRGRPAHFWRTVLG